MSRCQRALRRSWSGPREGASSAIHCHREAGAGRGAGRRLAPRCERAQLSNCSAPRCRRLGPGCACTASDRLCRRAQAGSTIPRRSRARACAIRASGVGSLCWAQRSTIPIRVRSSPLSWRCRIVLSRRYAGGSASRWSLERMMSLGGGPPDHTTAQRVFLRLRRAPLLVVSGAQPS